MPFLTVSFSGWEDSPAKIDKTEKSRVPTYSKLSNLDLVERGTLFSGTLFLVWIHFHVNLKTGMSLGWGLVFVGPPRAGPGE